MSAPRAALFYNRLASLTDVPGEAYDKQWVPRLPGHAVLTTLIGSIVACLPVEARNVLDLGCGTGLASLAALPRCAPGARVTLVDAAPRMLAVAQERLESRVAAVHACDFTTEDARELFHPQTFDLALCSYALTHLDDQTKRVTLERLAGCLAPGGLLIVVEQVTSDHPGGWPVVDAIHKRNLAALIENERLPNTADLLPEPEHLARVDDLTSWMARGGLAVGCPAQWLGSALFVGLQTTTV